MWRPIEACASSDWASHDGRRRVGTTHHQYPGLCKRGVMMFQCTRIVGTELKYYLSMDVSMECSDDINLKARWEPKLKTPLIQSAL